MDALVQDREVIFNLAGQVSHIDSMRDPYTDLDINCRAQLSMLEACRRHNPSVRVVFAGTRQVYGRPDRLPVDEQHLVRPADINGVNKAAGEYYHLLYNNVFGVRACSLRLTNVYGPRQLIKHNRQGFIGWFIRLAIEDREIQIFGDGSQLRDFVYVDDAADAFLRAGATDACDGEVFNVGGDEPISHRDLVALLLETAGAGSVRYVEWPPEKKRIDIGSFYSDSTKFRETVGLAAAGRPARRPAPDDRVLPRAPRPLRGPAARRPRKASGDPVPQADARRGRRRRARGHRPRGRARLVRARPGARSLRARVRGRLRRGTRASASAPAPTRSRSRCARSGIGPGDEVITSPLSAAYSALAIMMAGARPVFADIDPERLTLDPRAAAAAVTPRTAAILPVHLYGQPADMPAIAAVADAPRSGDRRGLLPGAPGHVRRTAGRQLRRGGGVQLLPDEEPRRARRRRRADDRGRRARGARPAAAQRRPDRSLPPRASSA